MQQEVKQFDSISKKYSSFVDGDPVRNFLHYPGVIRALGDIQSKDILDIGCGDGLFDRKLAKENGATVTGYDKAPDLIAIAQKEEENVTLGISYSIDDPLSFRSQKLFDEAVSIMVLPYSPDASYLSNFLASAYEHLKVGGSFISVVINPNFTAFGIQVANRVFNKLEEGKVEVNFLNPKTKELMFKAVLSQYSEEVYQGAAKNSGFSESLWEPLNPTKEGLELLGREFWNSCEELQPYALFIARK